MTRTRPGLPGNLTSGKSMENKRPVWLPDTQGFLALAIIALVAVIVLILLTHPPQIDERTSGVLMTIVGVLIACMKDVYAFFFGSSKGSKDKDVTLSAIASDPTPAAPAPAPAPAPVPQTPAGQ